MSAAEQHTPTIARTSGMWAPYSPPEHSDPLTELEKIGDFVLVSIVARDAVDTQHGKRQPIDLRVQTIDPEKTRLYSGFSAGILRQAKATQAGDLPAVCRIVKTPTPNGVTTNLEPKRILPAGVELSSIAGAMDVPIAPAAPPTDDIPY